MKQIFTLILTVLLICGTFASAALAAENPPASTDSQATDALMDTDTGSTVDTGEGTDTNIPSDASTITDDDKNTGTGTNGEELLPENKGSGDNDVLILDSGVSSKTEYDPVPDGFDYTGSVISFTAPEAFGSTFDMNCGDTTFTQLHSYLDFVDISGTVEKDGSSYSLTLSVTWDFSTVDAGTPGNYTIAGKISIPEGATLSDGFEDTITISIQVTSPVLTASPSAITLTSFDEPNRTDAVAFTLGTSQETLSKWFADSVAGFTGYDVQGNPYDLVSGEWSLDAVDTSTVGVYYASAAPDLGTEYTLANGVSQPRQLCAVSIQTPGEPDINCCVAARGFLRFPWVLSAEQQEQLDEFAVWLRQNGGEWTQLSEGFWFTSEDFQLSQQILEYGSTYELKVIYPGGQTGMLTFRYDGQLSIIDYSSGDRDGGDVNGSGSSTGSQPTPTPLPTPDHSQNDNGPDNDDNTSVEPTVTDKSADIPAVPTGSTVPVYSDTSLPLEAMCTLSASRNHVVSQPQNSTKAVLNPVPDGHNTPPEEISESQKPVTISESYSPTQTVISGLRLRDLCTDGESVVFGSGSLTASIPSKLLSALNLSDSDTLSVKLTQPESNQILLTVEAAGKSVTELPGTLLRFRYKPQSEDAQITVRNEGELITDASYDGELLRFTADTAGTYTILEASKAQDAQKGMSPLLPVSGGLILAAGGIIFFRWRRRHG